MASSLQQLLQVVWEIRIQSESLLQIFCWGEISTFTTGALLKPRSPKTMEKVRNATFLLMPKGYQRKGRMTCKDHPPKKLRLPYDESQGL